MVRCGRDARVREVGSSCSLSPRRLTNAAFMQTPQNGQTGYSTNYPALVRARVLYNYDVSGTMPAVGRLRDTWNGSSYTTGPILGAQCAYDPYKLLKTQTQWYAKNPNRGICPL